METTLIIGIVTTLIGCVILGVIAFKIREATTSKPHFYNKQGQEVSKAEMEAEMEVELEGMTTQGMSTKGIFNHDEYDNQFN